MMADIVATAVRTAVQTGWGYLVVWLLSLGITAPAEAPAWLTGAALALVTLGVTALIRWLETRSVSSMPGRLARRVGRWLMLGIVRQPTSARRMPDSWR